MTATTQPDGYMGSVDVIVPCYRYGNYLIQCVESVLGQSLPHLRVLIIDDASPDNTAEVAGELARSDSRVTVIRHTANRGHISTYNEGLDWASADYLLLLSADDYLLPGALHRSVNLMDAHRDVAFTYGKAITLMPGDEPQRVEPGERLSRTDVATRVISGPEFIMLSGADNLVPTPTAVVRTTLQKRVGGYRSELPHTGDMEMWLRLAAHGDVGMIEGYQAVYRRHHANMSLQYVTNSVLPDLEQRKAAIDSFLRECGSLLPNVVQARHRMLWALGDAAVHAASSVFNEGNMAVSMQLTTFAVEVCPAITRSWGWKKLSCKRAMGLKLWRALQPVVSKSR